MVRATVCWVHAVSMRYSNQLSSPNNDMVQFVPVTKPWMHPVYFGVDGAGKVGVGKCKVVVGTEFKKSSTIFIHFAHTMRSERAIPLIVFRSNPSVKVSGKNQTITFGNGRKWLAEKLIELILFLVARHECKGIRWQYGQTPLRDTSSHGHKARGEVS